MAIRWTEEQARVISARHSNLLVSAAAGSGKTAVLVERIRRLILDPVHPVDVDRLLVVTFTRAAAGEMKTRIMKTIAAAREQDPDNEHLARQLTLASRAQITTIDGFCSYVARSYGHTIGLVPGFRVAAEGELKLLRHDVISAVIEEAYERQAEGEYPGWEACVETFAPEKTDDRMEAILLDLYEESRSHPDPSGWLRMCRESNEDVSESSPWMQAFLSQERILAGDAKERADANVRLTGRPDGPAAYARTAEDEQGLLEALVRAESYEEWHRLLTDYEGTRLSSKKPGPEEDPALRETFKTNRETVTAAIKELKAVFAAPPDQAFADVRRSAGPLTTLLDLTETFSERYAEEKQKRGVMDFADLEHAALKILRGPDGRTDAARELAARYDEVMIDEYQDSNDLQEAILTAVSRIGDGEDNYTCIGDVKQSIYSFRQARPALFMRKFHDYAAHPESGTRIDLHRNFRSRREVIDTVNGIFRQIMRSEVGGVEYDDEAALAPGGGAEPEGDPVTSGTDAFPMDFRTEILPVLTGETDEEGGSLLEDTSARAKAELEARAIGGRIRQLVGGGRIHDPRTGAMRPVQYRDIVILMRSVGTAGESFLRVLESMRIPVYADTKGGYFDSLEVRTVLSFLSLLDNAQNDIAAAAVLRSAFVGLSAEEMAEVRMTPDAVNWAGSMNRDAVSYYDAARQYARTGARPALRGRLETFFGFYDSLKEGMEDTPLHELINRILTESGYLAYVSALPGGAQRELNLRMLVDQAAEYEQSSYIGLFHFVRYIENLKKQAISPDEQSAVAENENVVRIYTIHKSKGLEFPVVFLAGMNRRFNRQDMNASPLIHPELGLASDLVDLERRVRRTTLRREALRDRLRRDAAGEELRVLYVAMTRAREKLIITGTVKDEDALRKMTPDLPLRETQLPVNFLVSAPSFFSWIVPAAERMARRAELAHLECPLVILPTGASALAAEETATVIRREDAVRELRELKPEQVFDGPTRRMLEERFAWMYPYAGREQIPVEVSVSAIEHHLYDAAEAEDETPPVMQLVPEAEREESEPLVPAFIREAERKETRPAAEWTEAVEEKIRPDAAGRYESRETGTAGQNTAQEAETAGQGAARETGTPAPGGMAQGAQAAAPLRGAERGTAYHHVMQRMDFSGLDDMAGDELAKEISDRMLALRKSGILTEAERMNVRASDIAAFAGSGVGRRLARAGEAGRLFREQPFVLEVPASRIRSDWPEEEPVFVQGMIDAFFYEEGEVVLLDYKTDRIREEGELLRRYGLQLRTYADALAQATGKNVKERWIWSFALRRAVRADL